MNFCAGFIKAAGEVIHMDEWLKKHPHYRVEKKIQKMHEHHVKPKLKSAGGALKKLAPYAGLAGLGALAAYGAREDRKKRR